MIAVDTNILVYAHRTEAPLHKPAVAAVTSLAEGPRRGGSHGPASTSSSPS
ncbi:MAG: hypothetical protein ACRD0K_09590 [Egibacteraceae bacterium]